MDINFIYMYYIVICCKVILINDDNILITKCRSEQKKFFLNITKKTFKHVKISVGLLLPTEASLPSALPFAAYRSKSPICTAICKILNVQPPSIVQSNFKVTLSRL